MSRSRESCCPVLSDCRAEGGMSLEGLKFRAEQEGIALPAVIERLFAQAVAGQREAAFGPIPDREREHANRALESGGDAPGFKASQQGFGIGMAAPKALPSPAGGRGGGGEGGSPPSVEDGE